MLKFLCSLCLEYEDLQHKN
ncbi:hypothetical protein GH754_17240 [Salinibacillus xinjiangensis]|uniref:Uncharacterized protein n=1 Tax=Salinibacillus xinjiangensis TaxID=1229268 RepID=A0A6G1XAN8_9BACI|nr:hypothetical protein [Salinibacillus xinjiangensis]